METHWDICWVKWSLDWFVCFVWSTSAWVWSRFWPWDWFFRKLIWNVLFFFDSGLILSLIFVEKSVLSLTVGIPTIISPEVLSILIVSITITSSILSSEISISVIKIPSFSLITASVSITKIASICKIPSFSTIVSIVSVKISIEIIDLKVSSFIVFVSTSELSISCSTSFRLTVFRPSTSWVSWFSWEQSVFELLDLKVVEIFIFFAGYEEVWLLNFGFVDLIVFEVVVFFFSERLVLSCKSVLQWSFKTKDVIFFEWFPFGPALLLDFTEIRIFFVIFEERDDVLDVFTGIKFYRGVRCVDSLYSDRVYSFELVFELGVGEKIDSMNDDLICIWYSVWILGLMWRSVEGSADVEIHFEFEVLNVVGADCLFCLNFIGFESGSAEKGKDGFFDWIEVFGENSFFNVFFLQPLIVLLIGGILVLLIVVDFDDDCSGRDGFSGGGGMGLFNYRGHFNYCKSLNN